MNERIQELVRQAELPVIDGEWDYNDREILCQDDGEWRVATPAEIISVLFACEKSREKFAELIVRECISLIEPDKEHREDASWGYIGGEEGVELLDGCVSRIKEHFGVKE